MLKNFQSITDPRGSLTPVDFSKIPFTPKRIFYIKNVPQGLSRGGHAHFTTKQLLICLRGQIQVTLDTVKSKNVFDLFENDYIFIDNLVWDSQLYKTGNDILMSICSTDYNEKDYIKDYSEFLRIMKDKK
jgi:hypothetical protein